eukprot:UN01142
MLKHISIANPKTKRKSSVFSSINPNQGNATPARTKNLNHCKHISLNSDNNKQFPNLTRPTVGSLTLFA